MTASDMLTQAVATIVKVFMLSLVTLPATVIAALMDWAMLNWFIVPFLGIKPVPFLLALGLRYTLMMYRQRIPVKEEGGMEVLFWTMLGSTLIDLMALVCGFIIHLSYAKGI